MTNELYLNQIKPTYESLQNFQIHNNTLYFKDDTTYVLPLQTVKLYELNNNLFLLKPRNIYRIIYLLELFPKPELTDGDVKFIEAYVQRYLENEDRRLKGEEVDETELFQLGIPIYKSYDPIYIESKTSQVIQNVINNHSSSMEQSRGPKLVLANPTFKGTTDEDNYLANLEKAGFTTIFLIAAAIILTSLYIAFFVFSK
jgi:hypothetical protein